MSLNLNPELLEHPISGTLSSRLLLDEHVPLRCR